MRELLHEAVLALMLLASAAMTDNPQPASTSAPVQEQQGTDSGQVTAAAETAISAFTPAAEAALPTGEAAHSRPSAAEPLASFVVLSDIHIQSWDQDSHRKFAHALQDMQQAAPEASALILGGDLTNGMPQDYKKLAQLLKQNPHPEPVLYGIGNHEFYRAWHTQGGKWNKEGFPNGESDQASIQRFLEFTGQHQVYHESIIQGIPLLFLGSEQYLQSDPEQGEDAYLSPAQLDWLREKLNAHAPSGKPIFVFLHQPLPYTVSGTHFCCTNNRAVVQHEELKSILSGYPQVIYISGHTHWELAQPQTLIREKFTMLNASSVIETWTDNGAGAEVLKGSQESEGLHIELYEDRVHIRGRDLYRSAWIPEADFTLPLPLSR